MAPSPSSQAAPPPGADLQACIDEQLAKRGLDPYGEPPGTPHPDGPPVPPGSIERYQRVLDRQPAIRTACRASPPFK